MEVRWRWGGYEVEVTWWEVEVRREAVIVACKSVCVYPIGHRSRDRRIRGCIRVDSS